jgi:competence protein ComGF
MTIQKLACTGPACTKKKKQFAFLYQNERGYTLLNLLLSLFIYSIIISSLTTILHFLLSDSQHQNDLKPFEWELFIIQLHREMKEAENITVTESALSYTNKQGQLVNINRYQNLIRRQIGGQGHEIFLLKVQSVSFTQEGSGVRIHAVSEAGKDYSHMFRTFKDRTGA